MPLTILSKATSKIIDGFLETDYVFPEVSVESCIWLGLENVNSGSLEAKPADRSAYQGLKTGTGNGVPSQYGSMNKRCEIWKIEINPTQSKISMTVCRKFESPPLWPRTTQNARHPSAA